MSGGHARASAALVTASTAGPAAASVRNAAAETPAGDVLSDVLRAVRLSGALFFVVDGSTPWAAEAPAGARLAPLLMPGAQQIVSYHVVRDGGCWFSLAGGEDATFLAAGDVVVIPHGDAYLLSQPRLTRSPLPLEESLTVFRMLAAGQLPYVLAEGGGGSERVQLVCGFLGYDVLPFNPALRALPRALFLRRTHSAAHERLQPLLDLVVRETAAPHVGSDAVLMRLGELLFLELLRLHLLALPAQERGWLAGLQDPVVGRALALLHARSSEGWTLPRLAREVGISRSALAERFTGFLGEPPMRYLTRWRLQRAARLLVEGDAKVAAVAHAVGYDSEAAFSRAFKRETHVAPAAWRARRRSRRPSDAMRTAEPAPVDGD